MFLLFFITFLVGSIGAFVATKLKVPAPFMVGSMIFVGIFNSFTSTAYVYPWSRFLVQVIAGGFIGISMDKEKIKTFKTMLKPALVMMIGLLFLNIVVGFFLYKTTKLDLLSALFAAVPGGMSDMSIISSEMGADTSTVAIFQLARLIGVISLFPLLIREVHKKIYPHQQIDSGNIESTKTTNIKKHEVINLNETLISLIIAFAFGAIGKLTSIPAGTMIFSLMGISLMRICKNKGFIPLILKQLAQILAGTFIGCGITKTLLYNLKSFILPVIIMVLLYIIFCALLGYIMNKLFKIDLITAMFCCTPAGASDMALIASDLGANTPNIALLQIIRLITVIVLFPSIIKFITSL